MVGRKSGKGLKCRGNLLWEKGRHDNHEPNGKDRKHKGSTKSVQQTSLKQWRFRLSSTALELRMGNSPQEKRSQTLPMVTELCDIVTRFSPSLDQYSTLLCYFKGASRHLRHGYCFLPVFASGSGTPNTFPLSQSKCCPILLPRLSSIPSSTVELTMGIYLFEVKEI